MSGQRSKRVFIAGAAGAIGRLLCRLLVADGWTVIGTTRSGEKAALLGSMGVEPLVLDVFDEPALNEAMRRAEADFVIHQLTDLPSTLDPAKIAEALPRNARIREAGTRNLVAAAAAAGAMRMVAQSIAFAYAPGPQPWREEHPLNVDHPTAGTTARGVASLEQQVLAGPFEGVVLRYGRLYGPGTWFDAPGGPGPVHVEAAADAARRALTMGAAGIYNIAEDDGTVSCGKAAEALGWSPDFRMT